MAVNLGIDFGTTNTIVSYIGKKGKVKSLRYNNSTIIPTVVYFVSEDEILIGELAKKRGAFNPKAVVKDFKTIIDSKEKIEIIADNGDEINLKPIDIAHFFFSKINEVIQQQLIKEFGVDGVLGNVVITVPAKFTDLQKSNIKKAANRAGFEVAKLATESTAAAIASKREDGNFNGDSVLVYDFGGGTFDVSAIKEVNGKYEEIVPSDGDRNLGGNNLNDIIAEYLFERVNSNYGLSLPFYKDEFDESLHEISEVDYLKNRVAILDEANLLKETFGNRDKYESSINILRPTADGVINENFEYIIDKETFTALIDEKIKKTIEITERVLSSAESNGCKIENIVLAGGSSQLNLVEELVKQKFKNYYYASDVSTLISRGAALLAGEELESITSSVTNVEYGVSFSDGDSFGNFKPIIKIGESLPCKGSNIFQLNKDGQTSISIPYYTKDVKNFPTAVKIFEEGFTEIDSVIISGLPNNLKRSEVKICIEFELQRDGTLEVNVDIKNNNVSITNETYKVEKNSNLE